jgi:iron complex outermembrane receptor protein
LFAAAAVGALLPLSAANAADAAADEASATNLPEVVVTARRIEENIQKVPVTVTAVSPEIMKQQNITRPSDLMRTVPSLQVAPSFNRLNTLYSIRGLAAGVATYFAESPCCSGNASMPFQDIGQVQVLNGPQGTLFGRTSGSGAVLISPNQPELDEFGGSFEIRTGDYNRLQLFGVVNVPLIDDTLALRVSGNTNSVAGYTRFMSGNGTLDDENSQQLRIGLKFQKGNFDNYFVASGLRIHQSGSSQVLRAIAVDNVAIYNLTPAQAAVTFNAPCTTATNNGFYPSVATCVSERLATVQGIRARLVTELARVRGGGDAVRVQPDNRDQQPAFLWLENYSILNNASYEFEPIGAFRFTVKDIASVEWCTNDTASAGDGAGGGAQHNAAFNTCGVGKNNSANGRLVAKLGPASRTFNNDFQVHMDVAEGLIDGTVGGFYSKTVNPEERAGTGNIYTLFSGVQVANPGGYISAVGFIAPGNYSQQQAVYGQGTLDVSRFGIPGLKLTAGYRYSWDKNINTRYAAVLNNLTGVFTPGALSKTVAKSKGYNYTFSISEQFTPDLMVYATVARAYIPGGVNSNVQNNTGLPNYKPTFDPQIVLETEIGAKYEFRVGGMAGRINGALYNYDFTDIAVGFSGLVGTTSIAYTANVAGARLRGLELQGTLLPSPDWDIRVGYNYNQAEYTEWTASDPLNAARPGDAICLPSSPAGFCLLDLTNNPFARMPEHQANLTVVYHLPIDPDLGQVDLSVSGYYQSRVYFPTSAARQLQVLGPNALPGISEAPYGIVNLRANWDDIVGSKWSGAVYVSNVLDKIYINGATAQLLTLGFATGTYGPPRMISLELSRKF